MYDYGELELKILCCFMINPKLLEITKLETKHFKYLPKMYILFKSFYKKFGNLDIKSVCSLVKDPYKFMEYVKVLINAEVITTNFEMYESLLIELYEETEQEKYLREKVFELANDFYLKNIDSKQFKERVDTFYKNINKIT